MMFKDWRLCSQDSIPMDLQYRGLYYIHAQAWHIKGYLGGRHSWCTFNVPKHGWVTVELTTRETLAHQDCKVLWVKKDGVALDDHAPFISTRAPNKQWFGHDPQVVWIHPYDVSYEDVVKACEDYPIEEFNILTKNCNTFTSWLMYRLGIDVRIPRLTSIGWKSKRYWRKYDGTMD
jgi:hypothetical protein